MMIRSLLASAFLAAAAAAGAQSFADEVDSFIPGVNAGFGAGFFPANVLGAPFGNSNAQTPTHAQQHVLSLGTGGQITVYFRENRIVDQPGPDFTVFENPVQPAGQPDQSYSETAVVSVSADGDTWATFPHDIVSTDPEDLYFKANFIGFAGIEPSYSAPDNGISPFDPAVSGGDKFDLATVAMPYAKYVRIQDTGTTTTDADGDVVSDYGNRIDPPPTSPGIVISAGFDLDAVVALHSVSEPPTSCIEHWCLYE